MPPTHPTVLTSHKDVTVWDDLTVQDVTEETGRQPHTAERRTEGREGERVVSQTRLLDVSCFMGGGGGGNHRNSLSLPPLHLSPHILPSPHHTSPSFLPHISLLPPPSCRRAIFLLWNKRCSLMNEADQPAPPLSLRSSQLKEYQNVSGQN